jgi:hypothetical protein
VTAQLEAFTLLLSVAAPAFTQPSFGIFSDLVAAWVCCPSRHTITGLIGVADPEGRRAHDAYHRFFRAGAWRPELAWKAIATAAVRALYAGAKVLCLDVDDTLFHKSGRKVEGAGNFRDAIRSTRQRVVYALGLNLVVLTLRVRPPWGGEPLGLPINVRLFRKGGPTHNELAQAMLEEVAGWFPEHRFVLCGDGAFASLAAVGLARTQVVSRMRRDAALYEPAPPRTGKRGRPRKKGERLPSLQALAAQASWERHELELRGKKVTRLVYARLVLWYRMWPERQVLAVIVRDPDGCQADDYFFTTDLSARPSWVAETYAGRWSIEDTFRNTKQFLRGEDPQCWRGKGPERAAGLSLWIYTTVWLWYVITQGTTTSWPRLPWYGSKCTPSFLDALAALRRALWRGRIFATSHPRMLSPKITDALVETLARAA